MNSLCVNAKFSQPMASKNTKSKNIGGLQQHCNFLAPTSKISQRQIVAYGIVDSILQIFSGSKQQKGTEAPRLVSKLLSLCEPTDAGLNATQQRRISIEEVVEDLEQYRGRKPAANQNMFGTFEVVYASIPTYFGGPLRSTVGRMLLQEQKVYNVTAPPNLIGNFIQFKTLGLRQGCAGDRGSFEVTSGDSIKFQLTQRVNQIWGKAQVEPWNFSTSFEIVYLDERIRIARTPRGAMFVFKRSAEDFGELLFNELGIVDKEEENDEEDQIGTQLLDKIYNPPGTIQTSPSLTEMRSDLKTNIDDALEQLSLRNQNAGLATIAERNYARDQRKKVKGRMKRS